MDEVQSAYWSHSQISLHPIVVYFKDLQGTLQHKSFVFVSDDLDHSTAAVCTILKMFVPEMLKIKPDLTYIHYVTDGPTSQYRNKTMFQLVASHSRIYGGINATWQYLEAGHGKGPCDAIGGIVKRKADEFVKAGKVVIQSAEDFEKWANDNDSGVIWYRIHAGSDIERTKLELKEFTEKPVKGTLSIHSVVCTAPGITYTWETTCVCDFCFNNTEMSVGCPGWNRHNIGIPAYLQAPVTRDERTKSENEHNLIADLNIFCHDWWQ